MAEEQRFTTIRVPIQVKQQAEDLRNRLQEREDLRWIGTLALGAVLGYALAQALEQKQNR